MKDLKSSLLLYAVTDRYWLNGRKLKDDVEKAILGGATMIQLREKNLSTEDFIKEALEIKEVCKKYDIPFIINDSLEVFLAVDADGIHVGQNDLSADIVRKKIGPNKILGVSAETVSEALLAEKMGADYLGVGTIFSTSTKLDAINVTKEELARISYSVNIPVVAIGGITLDNIKELKNTMISGISVVSAIFKEEDIVKATSNLLKEVNKLFFNSDDYKLFIVDYDGTLLNSLSMWEDIASRYVKSKGIEPELDLDKIVKLQTNDETALYLSKKYFNNINPNDLILDIDSFIEKEYLKIKINKGALELLNNIKDKGKVVLFTATSKSLIEKSLKINGVENIFEKLYTSTNFNYTKTDGTGFIKLLENEKIKLEDAIVIEDSTHAICGAKNKGFKVLTIATYKNILDIDKLLINSDYMIKMEV
ncbi:MAG: thiamine phosphate synthase [Acholeplasmatales bacterium]|nr:thiamine phosphate synthase [Acholeplasmatales bacterium]